MRRAGVVMAVVGLVWAACTTDRGLVGRGRQGSWQRASGPGLTAGASHGIGGLVAPGDGYPTWTAVGSLTADAGSETRAAVWSSTDGTRWGRVELDHGDARESVAAAGARRQGLGVVVGSVTTVLGDEDAHIWTSTSGAAWMAVALPAPVGGGAGDQIMTSVAAGPPGFVAAGSDRSTGRAVPAIWWSVDGREWRRTDTGPGGPFRPEHGVAGVAVGRSGMVAVGTIDTDGDVDGMAWFSADGTTWRTLPLGAAGFTGPARQAVHAVTATADGFVAVGDDANGERRVAVVWTSPDGITWLRQPPSLDMAELPGAERTSGVSTDDIAGSGPLVSVGGGASLQVWGSPDGRKWTRDEPPVRGREPHARARVATDGRALLVRPSGGGLWFRPAGGAWADAGTNGSVFPRSSRWSSIRSAVRAGDRLLALGAESDGTTSDGDALWSSVDGRSWARQDTRGVFEDGRVDEVTGTAGLLVAVGSADPPSDPDRTVSAVWTSADGGGTWERVGADNPAFSVRETTQVFGATVAGPGLVAVGLSYALNRTIDAHAWVSADGRTWRRASEPPEWSGPGDQLFAVACALPDGGVVALGTVAVRGEQDVWAWVSRDGVSWERATGDGASVLGGAGNQYPGSCASTATGVLVAGVDGPDGVVWSTSDGVSWSTLGGPATFSTPGEGGLGGIAADGARLVVTGRDDDDLVVFTSADAGSTWRRLSSESFRGPGLQFGQPIIVGDEVVVAGVDRGSAGVWIGPAP